MIRRDIDAYMRDGVEVIAWFGHRRVTLIVCWVGVSKSCRCKGRSGSNCYYFRLYVCLHFHFACGRFSHFPFPNFGTFKFSSPNPLSSYLSAPYIQRWSLLPLPGDVLVDQERMQLPPLDLRALMLPPLPPPFLFLRRPPEPVVLDVREAVAEAEAVGLL